MEYLEGSTLGQLIGGRALPQGEVLNLALEIAEALDAAHTASILHRDLKPANIVVTSHGRAKVLDFGIAKRGGAWEAPSSQTPTAVQLTSAGEIVGTGAYMAPEQVRGELLDGRSDFVCLRDRAVRDGDGHASLQRADPGSGDRRHSESPACGSTAQNLWRINADGSEPFQLTDFPHTQGARCSPMGQWVVFYASTGLHRVRTSGGAAEMLDPRVGTSGLLWSPDSKAIAFVPVLAKGARTRHLAVITPGAGTRTFDLPGEFTGDLAFTPAGGAIAYLLRHDGRTSIRIQPLDGSAPRVMALGEINFDGRLSPDGSKVAVMRQRLDSDVMLLRDGAAHPR